MSLTRPCAADFVLVGPAEIAHRSEVDEPDLELVRGRKAPEGCIRRRRGRGAAIE